MALTAADRCADHLDADTKVICLATAHAAKFPDTMRMALAAEDRLPDQARHATIEAAKKLGETKHTWELPELASALPRAMQSAMRQS